MAANEKKDLDQLSNEHLNAMFAPLPYRETDPMERRRQVGGYIMVPFIILLILYLLVFR
jgi:hypothetical protein